MTDRIISADSHIVEPADSRGVAVERPPFSPAQLIALAAGIFFVVIGGIAMSRTGVHAHAMTRHVTGPLWHHTTWLGIGELVFGLFMIGAGVVPGAARGMMTFFGMIAVGWGVAVLVDATDLHPKMGVHTGTGWVYIIAGGVILVSAMLSPVFFTGERAGYARRRAVLT